MASCRRHGCNSGRMNRGIFRKLLALAVVAVTVAAVPTGAFAAPSDAEKAKFFADHVKPLLDANCIKCHGGEKTKGGLKLTSRQSILKGGDTGPAVSTDQPDQSLLLKAIGYADPDLQMPPKNRLN